MLLGQAAPARPAAGLSRGAGASPTGGRRRGLPKDVGAASLPRWTVSNDATRPKPARSPDERPSAPALVMIGVHAGSEMTRTGRRFLPPLPLLRLLSPAAPAFRTGPPPPALAGVAGGRGPHKHHLHPCALWPGEQPGGGV